MLWVVLLVALVVLAAYGSAGPDIGMAIAMAKSWDRAHRDAERARLLKEARFQRLMDDLHSSRPEGVALRYEENGDVTRVHPRPTKDTRESREVAQEPRTRRRRRVLPGELEMITL